MFKGLVAAGTILLLAGSAAVKAETTAPRILSTFRALALSNNFPPLPVDTGKCRAFPPANPNRVVCEIDVVVSDLPRCNPEVKPGAMVVTHSTFTTVHMNILRENFHMVWNLRLRVGSPGNIANLSFLPEAGIEVLQGSDPDQYEFGGLKVSDPDGSEVINPQFPIPRVMVRSLAQTVPPRLLARAFHYNVTILRKNNQDQWVQCGAIDPLIVNTD